MRVGAGAHSYTVAEPWQLGIEGASPDVAGIAVNSKDEVHVLTRGRFAVLVFDRAGRPIRRWGEGVFGTTHGIHIGPDDAVYIVDAGDSTVRKFSPTGELLLQLGKPNEPADSGYRDGDYRTIAFGGPPFNAPTNVAVADSNEIYVSDGYGNARIHRFAEDGTHLGSWGEPGRAGGQFQTPHGICIDRRGTVYVADRENDRVQRFSPSGEFLGEWTGIRRASDVFVTADDLVFVAEMGYVAGVVVGMDRPTATTPPSRVTIRDLDGQVKAVFGGDQAAADSPCDPGNFFAAHGIWVDREGSVYVGEVISAVGPSDAPGGVGWVPSTCHALQVFHRA